MEVSTLLVGVIAVSVAVMAAIQVGIIIYGARLASRVDRFNSASARRNARSDLCNASTFACKA